MEDNEKKINSENERKYKLESNEYISVRREKEDI